MGFRRRLGGVTTAALLVALPGALAAPADATDGWLTDGEGGVYRVDRDTWVASVVGTTDPPPSALAARGRSQLLAVVDVTGAGQHLVAFDPVTLEADDRGRLDDGDHAGLNVTALTTLADGTLVAASLDPGAPPEEVGRLHVVDPATADLTDIGGGQPHQVLTLAGACGGELLGVDEQSHLVTVDPVTGASTLRGDLDPVQDGQVALAFDHTDRTLVAVVRGDSGEEFYTVDADSGDLTPTTHLPGSVGSGVLALAFDSPGGCRYQRTVTLAYSERRARFTGRVGGEYAPCAARTKVAVYRVTRGSDERLGTATTGATGRFVLRHRPYRGRAYVVAVRTSDPATGTCLAARSPAVG